MLIYVLLKTRNWAFSRRRRAKTGKRYTKKASCTCKVVVLLIKPFVFLTFSLPSASLDLKVPSDDSDDGDNSDNSDNTDSGDNSENGDNSDNSDNSDNGDKSKNSDIGEQ